MTWIARARRTPSALLLAAQLGSLCLFPVIGDTGGGRLMYAAIATVVVALALWVVNRSPAMNWFAWLFAAPAILLTLSALLLGHGELLVWASLCESVLYFYAAGALIAYMLHDHEVSGDELFASGATFTLLAWGFAYTFVVLQALQPGSFAAAVNAEQPRSWTELMFLSFALLSSTGIGDVIPIRPLARALTSLEMFVGVMYLAAVVSRLVGLTLLRR